MAKKFECTFQSEIVETDSSSEIRKPRSLGFRILQGLLWGILLAYLGEIGRMIFTHNQHVVLEDRVYRTAQLNPQGLRDFVGEHHISTVINLRGRPISDWYPAETQVSQQLAIGQEDVTLSACRLPAPSEIRRLIHLLDRVEYPVLLHCQQGADRSGLASVIVLLLYSDADYETARRQCSPRYGHFPVFHTKEMDRFFDMYEAWLAGNPHSPQRFRDWANHHYLPGNAVASLELIPPKRKCRHHPPVAFHVKATNKSREPWHFHESGQRRGVTLRYVVDGPKGRVCSSRTGYLSRCVHPGESIEFDLTIPRIAEAGLYRLHADLAQDNFDFAQFGSQPIDFEWDIAPDKITTSDCVRGCCSDKNN